MGRPECSRQQRWRHVKPAWWMLYAGAALIAAVVGLVEVSVDREGLRTVLEVLAVVAGFGLAGVWRRHNRIALELEQWRRGS